MEILISNGLATVAVKVTGIYTGTQNPAVQTALEFALCKFAHDNVLEIIALADLDDNADGKIDASDAAFASCMSGAT